MMFVVPGQVVVVVVVPSPFERKIRQFGTLAARRDNYYYYFFGRVWEAQTAKQKCICDPFTEAIFALEFTASFLRASRPVVGRHSHLEPRRRLYIFSFRIRRPTICTNGKVWEDHTLLQLFLLSDAELLLER
jgi:hypothetical protein